MGGPGPVLSPAMARLPKLARDVLSIGVLALGIFSARSSLADHYVVPSGSMRPTVEVGDRIFVDKLAYGVHLPFTRTYLFGRSMPARGDVVVLDSPVEDVTLLKRVVAIPGDRVEVTAGRLFINGREVPVEPSGQGLVERLGIEPHGVRLTHGGGPALPETTLPEDRYLVLGDNRGESADGRYFGLVE
ncbi:signal peptidase I, partial [Myxococcota bacterium]|nr:signal peptidase I [Myxococcota bacterium]